MKAPGTWPLVWIGGAAAMLLGGLITAYVWIPRAHVPVVMIVGFGIVSIICLGCSRVEEDDAYLETRERELETKLAKLRERQERLRRYRAAS